MSSASSPAMPAFSYAQAAKGLAPAATQPAKDIKDDPLDANQFNKGVAKPELHPQPPQKPPRRQSRVEEKDVKKSTKDEAAPESSREESQEKDSASSNRRPQQKTPASSVASPRIVANNDATKDGSSNPAQTETLDASVVLDRESNASEKGKTKENEDDWEKISIPSSAAAEKELKAAPIPVVNIWQQRKEAQEAKKRDVPTAKANTSAPITTKQADDGKRKGGHEREVSRSVNKSGERTDTQTQSARPVSREKQDSKAVVGDSTAWPTPETANTDDRKKSTQAEKVAPLNDARINNNNKPHGKQWVQMPFVPTAKFETQLPASAAKRGGRSGRAGREGGGRGAHFTNNGERSDNAGSMGPPPPPREDRGRKNEGARGGRASSLPAHNQRATSHENDTTNARKPSAPIAKDAIPPQAPAAAPFVPIAEQNPGNVTSEEPSRSSSSQKRTGTSSPKGADNATPQSVESPFGIPAQTSFNESIARQNATGDRNKPSHGNYRSNEYSRPERNGGPRNPREYTREKSANAYEKVESWRDREYSGEGPPRQGRPDRGRGSYRGRANFNPNYQSSHSYTSPLPQNGFDVSKPQTESRPRQTSQPYSQNAVPQARTPGRTQSIPLSMIYPPQNFYGNMPIMQSGMQLQTDMAYGMTPQVPMHQSIMSAMPYNDSLSSYAVLSLVASQLQYYFSIDNLCKDMFLRKNMDSQGWVLLSVIAGFKRIRQLTEEKETLNLVRDVLSSLHNDLEYVKAQDGKERIRRKDGWQDFVLPMSERVPAAQNDGPALANDYSYHHYQQLPEGSGEAMPFVPSQMRSPPSGMNGMYNGPTSPSAFAMVPPYDGSGDGAHMPHSARFDQRDPTFGQDAPRTANGPHQHGAGMNGHHRTVSRSFTEENVFPDEEVAQVHVLKRELSQTGDDKSMSVIEPVRSHESQSSLRGAMGRKASDQ